MVARASRAVLAGLAIVGLGLAVVLALPPDAADVAATLYPAVIGGVALVSIAIVVWHVEPAYTLSAAIVLSPLAGNWPQLGVPGPLSPDRLLLAGAILAILLRAPPIADRPALKITGAHWVLGIAAVYALASSLVAGTLHGDQFLLLVDSFGIMPFLIFLVAPLAFRTEDQRRVLLAALVGLGAYLGLTVLFETMKLDALVFPRYILDETYGIHVGRGRGPFVEAVTNGLALYMCAVACAIAVATWRTPRIRGLAVAIGVLCMIGCFLTLQRSVWIGAVLASCVTMLAARGPRRYLLPVGVAVAVGIAASLVLIPGVSDTVGPRVNQGDAALWDRRNLARAGLNMVQAKPLFGFGWGRFTSDSADYFQQAFDYPLTATEVGLHNTPLTYAVELGLIGVTLWLLGVVLGVGGALATRGPPDLMHWRLGLLAIAIAYVVVMSAVPPATWLNRSLWLIAGVVFAGRYIQRDTLAE